MKKVFLTLSIAILLSIQSLAQYKGGIEIGGNLMAASEFVIQDSSINTSPSWGIRLGYVANYRFGDTFFARGAVLINQRGFNYADERWGLSIIDIPLNIGLNVPVGDNGKQWFVDAGINLEFNFRAFTRINDDLVILTIGTEEGDIKPFSTGFNIGTGFRFNEKIDLRVNYYQGLVNLLQNDTDVWKNYVVGAAVIFYFGS